ncbi:hypothetical protein ACFLZZ_01340 [Nanoarchaeota archaeon]
MLKYYLPSILAALIAVPVNSYADGDLSKDKPTIDTSVEGNKARERSGLEKCVNKLNECRESDKIVPAPILVPASAPAPKPKPKKVAKCKPLECKGYETDEKTIRLSHKFKKEDKTLYGMAERIYNKEKAAGNWKGKFSKHDFACRAKLSDPNSILDDCKIKVGQRLMIPHYWNESFNLDGIMTEKPEMTKADKLEMIDTMRDRNSLQTYLGGSWQLGKQVPVLGIGGRHKSGWSAMLLGSPANTSTEGRIPGETLTGVAHPITGIYKQIGQEASLESEFKGMVGVAVGKDFGRYFTGIVGLRGEHLEDRFNINKTNYTMKNGVVLGSERAGGPAGTDSVWRVGLDLGGEANFGWLKPQLTDLYLRYTVTLHAPAKTKFGEYEHVYGAGFNEASANIGVSYRWGGKYPPFTREDETAPVLKTDKPGYNPKPKVKPGYQGKPSITDKGAATRYNQKQAEKLREMQKKALVTGGKR